jgi:signal transduction histidine kinase
LPVAPGDGWSPARITLAVAWICVLFAVAAVAVLLVGTVSLSERRAAFVSAVTHEMRTPLTTFQMYTEMLGEGMVADEEKRSRYVTTLRVEAGRLGHLIENVLSYARLERGRHAARLDRVPVKAILDGATDRLRGRAEQAGMSLVVENGDPEAAVRADPSAVEQILFNLVDNACKYAAPATDRRIHLAAADTNGRIRFSVRDHGPGVPDTDRRRLFRPFSKSAREAASTAPGVGLGLALSRRLARRMGGELRVEDGTGEGAHFTLELPRA